MDALIKDVMRECTEGSDAGRMPFPQVVRRLMEAGVERYYADLQRAEKTFYLPEGESHVVPSEAVEARPGDAFSRDGVERAVRAIQAGTIDYKTFCL